MKLSIWTTQNNCFSKHCCEKYITVIFWIISQQYSDLFLCNILNYSSVIFWIIRSEWQVSLRDDCVDHFKWIFEKLPNGLWPPPLFQKTMLHFFWEAQKFATKFIRICVTPPPFSENSLFLPPQNFRKNRNEIFRIGNDPPPIRKFSENSLNLVQVVTPKMSVLFYS